MKLIELEWLSKQNDCRVSSWKLTLKNTRARKNNWNKVGKLNSFGICRKQNKMEFGQFHFNQNSRFIRNVYLPLLLYTDRQNATRVEKGERILWNIMQKRFVGNIYAIYVVSKNVQIDCWNGLQGHEREYAHEPRDHQPNIFLRRENWKSLLQFREKSLKRALLNSLWCW